MGSLLSPKENTETSNFQIMYKGLSTSLPDLDSEPWIEVKKRHRASTVKLKVKSEPFKLCLNKQVQNTATFRLYCETRFFIYQHMWCLIMQYLACVLLTLPDLE